MNFIKEHLVKQIKSEYSGKRNSCDDILNQNHKDEFSGYFYFDMLIKCPYDEFDEHIYIERINRSAVFGRNKKHLLHLNEIPGNILIKIYRKLKNNEFYFYDKIDKKSYKLRIKK